jgi:ubiquinone/menaquinone biosynthesis C-methylase UbiE
MSATVSKPRFARTYVKAAARAERRGATDHRRRLLEGLSGRVVEVGAGHGLNFAHYPTAVTEVIAIEPESTLREQARQAAAEAPVPVTVMQGTADALPLGDCEADGVVASLVLCSVPDQVTALAEARRVLRPGGELRFYEHVIARCQPKRTMLLLADRSGLWPMIAGGCHPARDTASAIEAAGFEIERSDRFMFSAGALEPSVPHIVGLARSTRSRTS